MDGAPNSTRKYPAYTTAQLERFVEEGSGTPAMVQEISDRKAGKSTIRSVPQLTPSGESQALDRAEKERKVHADVLALVEEYKANGKASTMAMFDRIAKKRRMKNFEAHLLIVGFQRECRAQGISF